MAFTLDWMDNFEYPDTAALAKAWPVLNSFTSSASFPRTGARSLRGGGSSYASIGFPTPRRSVVCGFSFYFDGTWIQDWPIMFLSQAPSSTSSTGQIVISVTPAGTVKVWRGHIFSVSPSGTVLGESAVVLNPSNAQNHIQLKAFIHDTLGYVKVAVNGVEVFELTNVDTRHQASYDYFNFFGLNSPSSAIYYDDLIVGTDDSTSVTSQDLFGDCSIIEQLPNGTGTYNDLASSSAGTPYTDVDESLLNEADYNYSATPGAKSSYTISDIAGTPTIKAVGIQWMAAKDTAGYREVRPLSKSGATETPYAYQSLSLTGNFRLQGMLVDPNTGAAWTVAGANALEIGVEIL